AAGAGIQRVVLNAHPVIRAPEIEHLPAELAEVDRTRPGHVVVLRLKPGSRHRPAGGHRSANFEAALRPQLDPAVKLAVGAGRGAGSNDIEGAGGKRGIADL